MAWNWILLFIPLFPMAAGLLMPKGRAEKTPIGIVAVEMAAVALLFAGKWELEIPAVFGMGLSLGNDGFRSLYCGIAGFMWLCTTLFSREYMAHYPNKGRYWRATLVTLGATLGVFLSDDLFTTFVFFEMMSFASYPWVAHDETPGAMKAAETYLAVAVIGGMATLTGMFMLHTRLGTLGFEEMRKVCAGMDKSSLYLPAGLVLVGFAAKAGAFPLHIWLPKAHPVAPAPASALLSGMLTKTGIFGVMVLSVFVMGFDGVWGQAVMYMGVVTMLLGAVLAVFSVNLKRTLACSSVSQIGFILTGVGLLGRNALAGQGTILHMVNHSLIKLALFMAAGAVYMKLHKLDLNELRGYGRKKPVLMFVFLLGAVGISGVPMFNGYFSKTVLHEAIVEAGVAGWVEWVFLFTGGLTFAYMIKLCVVLFVDKHPTRQKQYEGMKDYLSPLSKAVFVVCGALLPAVGWLNGPIAHMGESFLGFHAHEVHFFSWVCLSGGLISLGIGIVVYFLFIRRVLMKNGEYLDLWPEKADLERVYRWVIDRLIVPAAGGICRVCDGLMDNVTAAAVWAGAGAARICDRMMDMLVKAGIQIGTVAARICDEMTDGIAWLMGRGIFRMRKRPIVTPLGNRLTDLLGEIMDGIASLLNRSILRKKPIRMSFVSVFAAVLEETTTAMRRVSRSLSFGMLLFCIGLLITLVWILL